MPSRALLITVRLLNGGYHGVGDWPPSPFRLFQALVAGAYGGRWRQEAEAAQQEKDAAFIWLEGLAAPHIAAPPKIEARATTYYVPNNDRDAVERGKFANYRDYLKALADIRVGKVERLLLVGPDALLLYALPFKTGEDEAQRICEFAERPHTLGRGVDPAFAVAEVVDWGEAERRLQEHGGAIARPSRGGGREPVPCPTPGSLDSLKRRHAAQLERFVTAREGRSLVTLFRQPPKPRFRGVVYDRPPRRLLFDLKPAEGTRQYQPIAQSRATEAAKFVRDRAAARLNCAWPERAVEIDRVIVGRGAGPADKERRIRIVPLPSIGTDYTDPAIRRILVEIPPDCPFAVQDIAWSVSGLSICDVADPETGEIVREGPLLVPAEEDAALSWYGIGRRPARRWQTVTPAALGVRRPAGRTGGEERKAADDRAVGGVANALRHAGIGADCVAVRVQTEPFHLKGLRADAFAPERFDARALRHVEVQFRQPVRGPLVIGNGRWLGLGLMRPVYDDPLLHIFSLGGDRAPVAKAELLARALRRAVMSLAQAQLGRGVALSSFFTGHRPDGGPLRSGSHEHLFFLADDADGDGWLDRLAVITPQLADRSLTADYRRERRMLGRSLASLSILRAGAAGAPSVRRLDEPDRRDLVFGHARDWESRTPYRPTRHPHRTTDAAEAVRRDVVIECGRRGLPRPEVEIVEVLVGPRGGIAARLRLSFEVAVTGPLLFGAGSHFGAGLFAAVPRPDD